MNIDRRHVRYATAVIALTAITMVTACGGNSPEQSADTPSATTTTGTPATTSSAESDFTLVEPVELTLEPDLDDRTVEVHGRLALPDGALVSVSVNRLGEIGSDRTETGRTLDYGDATVENGRFAHELTIDDAVMADAIDGYNFGADADDLMSASDRISVVASFSPDSESQPEEVIATVGGPSGDRLESSPQANLIGELTANPHWSLRAEHEITAPYNPDPPDTPTDSAESMSANTTVGAPSDSGILNISVPDNAVLKDDELFETDDAVAGVWTVPGANRTELDRWLMENLPTNESVDGMHYCGDQPSERDGTEWSWGIDGSESTGQRARRLAIVGPGTLNDDAPQISIALVTTGFKDVGCVQ